VLLQLLQRRGGGGGHGGRLVRRDPRLRGRGLLRVAAGVRAGRGLRGPARPPPDGGGPGGRERDALEACAILYEGEACGILYGAASVPALRLLPLTGQAGIGCDAALAGSAPAKARMAAANREFDQLSTMATALLNKLT